jgi:hypothetical protein
MMDNTGGMRENIQKNVEKRIEKLWDDRKQ